MIESRMNGLAKHQLQLYCETNRLDLSDADYKTIRTMEALRSIYDYTVGGKSTNRIRIYVTILGKVGQHTLVEDPASN